VWQGARPDSPTLIVLDSVSETLGSEWALCAEGFGCLNRAIPNFLVGEVLGEENVWGGLARRTAVVLDGLGKVAVGLSVVTHNLILEEDFDGS
jgi:hypothetical protein